MKIPSSITVKQLKDCLAKFKDTDRVGVSVDYATSEDSDEIEGDTGVRCALDIGDKTVLENYTEM